MTLKAVLITGTLVFSCGLYSVFSRRNLISMLMGIELLLNGVTVNFAGFAYFRGDNEGRIMVLFIISIAAMEAAVLLSLIYSYYKSGGTLDETGLRNLKH